MPDPSPPTLTVLNSNFLQLGRRSGGRPQPTVYPRRFTWQLWNTLHSWESNPRPSDQESDAFCSVCVSSFGKISLLILLLKLWKLFDWQVKLYLNSMPHMVTQLLSFSLRRLEADIGHSLVSTALSLLACCRVGQFAYWISAVFPIQFSQSGSCVTLALRARLSSQPYAYHSVCSTWDLGMIWCQQFNDQLS